MKPIKALSKLTAVALSLSLIAGAAGSTAPQKALPKILTSSAYEKGQELYEYELKNVYVVQVRTDGSDYYRITLFPQDENGTYDYFRSIELTMNAPYYNYDETTMFRDKDVWDVTEKNLQYVTEGSEISLTVCSEYDYGTTEIKQRGGYDICGIKSVKSSAMRIYGDINDDGVVDTYDLVDYRAYVSGSNLNISGKKFENADIDKDDDIDGDDLQQVADFLLGKATEFNMVGQTFSTRLDNTVDIESALGKATNEEFADAEMDFGVKLLQKCFDPSKEENLLISPVSISSALAMTANGADNETLAEMEKVLGNGLTLDQINDYMAYYMANLPNEKNEKLAIANSIWFRDDPTFKVYDDFLKVNKKFYGSEIYKTEFNDNTVSDVNGWVNRNTQGMIPKLLDKGDLNNPLLMMLLINSLYFEADWQVKYEQSYDGFFTDLNGNKHNIKEMYSEENEYYDLGDADAFVKPYVGGDYKFVGIMPRDKDIVEYVSDLDAKKLAEGLRNPVDPDTYELHVMIPKFKYSYSKTLSDVLAELGMSKAFSPVEADFSKINDLSVEGAMPLYIDEVLHKTRIEVTESGTKAAAVTAVLMKATSAAPQKKIIKINLDKPFVYMILDKNNTPIFIGAATKLEE